MIIHNELYLLLINSVQLIVVSVCTPLHTTTVSSRSDMAGNVSVAFVVNELSELITVDTKSGWSSSLSSIPLNFKLVTETPNESIVQVRIFNPLSGLSTAQLILMISPGSACVPSTSSVLQYCPPDSATEASPK